MIGQKVEASRRRRSRRVRDERARPRGELRKRLALESLEDRRMLSGTNLTLTFDSTTRTLEMVCDSSVSALAVTFDPVAGAYTFAWNASETFSSDGTIPADVNVTPGSGLATVAPTPGNGLGTSGYSLATLFADPTGASLTLGAADGTSPVSDFGTAFAVSTTPGGALNNLTINDQGDTAGTVANPQAYALSDVSLQIGSSSPIDFSASAFRPDAALTLNAGTGPSDIVVTGTPAATTLALGAAAGCAVAFGSKAGAATALDPVTITTIPGTSASLKVDDSTDPLGRTFKITGTGLENGTSPLVDFSGASISALTIDGGPGGNAYDVDYGSGPLFGMALNINGGGSDSLSLSGAPDGGQDTASYDIAASTGPGHAGTIAYTTAARMSQVTTFTGLAPVYDTTRALSLSLSDAGIVTVSNLVEATTGDTTYYQMNDSGQAESYNFLNKSIVNVAISSVGGAFTEDVPTNLNDGLAVINVAIAGAGDLVNLSATPPRVTSNVAVAVGAIVVRVGSGSLAGIGGTINVATAGLIFTGLDLDDSADTAPATGLLTVNNNTGIGSFTGISRAPINFTCSILDALTIDGGRGANTFDIAGTPTGITTTINAGSGTSNLVDLGYQTSASSLGNVDIATGAGGTTALVADDSAGSGKTIGITSTQLVLGTSPVFDYSQAHLAGLTLDTSNAGNNTVTVTGAPVLTAFDNTINMGAGPGNAVVFGDSATPASTIGGNYSVSTFGDGSTSLRVDDSAYPQAESYILSLGGAGDSLSLGVGIEFDFTNAQLTSLTVDGGTGGNRFAVDGTPGGLEPTLANPNPPPVVTTLNSGTGNNTTVVTATSDDSQLDINGQGGTDTVAIGTGNPAQSDRGNTSNIDGDIAASNTTPTTALIVDDSADRTPASIAIGATSVEGIALGSIAFPSGVSSVSLFGGKGTNDWTICDTSPNVPVMLATGKSRATPGNTLRIVSTSSAVNIDAQADDAIQEGTGLLSQLTDPIAIAVDAGKVIQVTLDDSADPTGGTATLSSDGDGDAVLIGLPIAFSQPVAELNELTVRAGTGGQTMNVDFTQGDPLPAGTATGFGLPTFQFTAAGGAPDTLNLYGNSTSFTGETYQASGPGAGTLTFNSAAVVAFSGLQPVNDVVPATTYTFVAPAPGQFVDLGDGPLFMGDQTGTISSPASPPGFELVNFANKTNVDLNTTAGTGSYGVVLDQTIAALGQTTTSVTMGAADDTVAVEHTTPGVATAINTGGGNDQVTVVATGLATGFPPSSLSIDGGTGVNALQVNAQGTTAKLSTYGTVKVGGAFGGPTFAYANVSSLTSYNTNHAPSLSTSSPIAMTVQQGQPLVDLTVGSFTDPDLIENAASYLASINWGDGTPATSGTIAADPTVPGRYVITGNHVYAATGTASIVVAVTDLGGTFNATVVSPGGIPLPVATRLDAIAAVSGVTAQVRVNDPPTPTPTPTPTPSISGRLSPQSDSGISNSDGITNVSTPTFVGNASPGAIVQVYETPAGQTVAPLLIATGVANASGSWSATVANLSLSDFTYQITAVATIGGAGASASLGTVVIDTVAPVITGIVFNRSSGTMMITYQDNLSGVYLPTLANGANYRLAAAPLSPKNAVPRRLLPTTIAVTGGAVGTAPATAAVRFNGGKALGNGSYTFRILSAGINDIAGNTLAGAFYGSFPTGPSQPFGNFAGRFTAIHGRVYGPFPIRNGFAKPPGGVPSIVPASRESIRVVSRPAIATRHLARAASRPAPPARKIPAAGRPS